jgi:hypothetical protein
MLKDDGFKAAGLFIKPFSSFFFPALRLPLLTLLVFIVSDSQERKLR